MTRSDFMIKWGVYALAILPIWFLEVYVLNRLPVLGVTPMLMPLAAVAAAVFYGYYRYENRNEIACREQGGVWDGEKGVCGDKTGWTEKLEELWKRFADGKEDEKKETPGGREK